MHPIDFHNIKWLREVFPLDGMSIQEYLRILSWSTKTFVVDYLYNS